MSFSKQATADHEATKIAFSRGIELLQGKARSDAIKRYMRMYKESPFITKTVYTRVRNPWWNKEDL